MLVTFSTDAYANITMFGDHALAMLKMMGHSGTVPGALKAEEVPHALSRLKTAIESGNNSPPIKNKYTKEPELSMAHRGLPLINLLSAAAKAKDLVMWNKSTSLS
jgi:Domain of unknown function (DUF1840)